MAERVMPGPVEDMRAVREAVCVHTKKIYDSCRDKDCIEDLRFYPQMQYADVISRAMSVKGGSARLLHVYVDVEPVSFNRGFYTVDMRFFYHVSLQAYLSNPIPVTVEGLCVFDKRTILFGSEGNAKIFSSEMRVGEPDIQRLQRSNLPMAVVEAVDPIVLDARIVDRCDRRDRERNSGFHQQLLWRGTVQRRRRTARLYHAGPVLHCASGTGYPAADPHVRLLHPLQGLLRQRRRGRQRRPVQHLPQHRFPGGRVLPAQLHPAQWPGRAGNQLRRRARRVLQL